MTKPRAEAGGLILLAKYLLRKMAALLLPMPVRLGLRAAIADLRAVLLALR